MTPDPHAYAAELRGIRRFLSLSQRDMAELLATDTRLINRWESGRAPVPPSAIDTMRSLERDMKARLVRHIATLTKAPPGPITLIRDRDELDAHDPFFRDKPIALHEWEVVHLARRTNRAIAYSVQHRAAHPSRAPYRASASILEGPPGKMRFTPTAPIADALRQVANGHLSAATVPEARDALACIEAPEVDWFALAETIGYDIIQPWDTRPFDFETVRREYLEALRAGKHVCLVILLTPGREDDSTSELVLEIAGIRFGADDDPTLNDHVWASGLSERRAPVYTAPIPIRS